MATIDYVIIAIFLAGIFWLGSRLYRWIGDPDDFYVAGRQLTPFVLAAALTTANISLFSLIGVSGTAYQSGISIIWMTWTGNMSLVFSGLFIVPVLRRLRVRTIPEFLEMRYGPVVRGLVAVVKVVRITFWIGVVLYAGIMAAEQLTGIQSFTFWLVLLAAIVVIYTTAGGMWSIVLTNNLGFFFMMLGVLIVLPKAMSAVGWWRGLAAHLPADHLTFVMQDGPYNWKFIIAILLLGVQWASLDQGLLQPAFSARNSRVVAQGMVLSGIMISPFAFLWISPGLAAHLLYPGLAKPELAVPTLVLHLLPAGVLGLVICGFMASGLSTIGSNLGAVATLISNDLYHRFFNPKATPRQTLMAVRLATVFAGVLMVAVTYLIPYMGGAVDAYLSISSIMDMPLFVIGILFGLVWKKVTWQAAMAGYLVGAGAGAIMRFGFHIDVAAVTLLSGAVTAVVCPILSLFGAGSQHAGGRQFAPVAGVPEEEKEVRAPSFAGRLGLWILAGGFLLFLVGLLMGSRGISGASAVAIGGMAVYFIGGALRAKFA
jgi:SSS family solute:Na+ symporter